MLVSYMQLLGLLRLVRIDWRDTLSQVLTFLDLTSSASTWVSIECSMAEGPLLPRSIKRSLVLLLWPREYFGVLGGKAGGWGEGSWWVSDAAAVARELTSFKLFDAQLTLVARNVLPL